jgi:hypothetical protein
VLEERGRAAFFPIIIPNPFASLVPHALTTPSPLFDRLRQLKAARKRLRDVRTAAQATLGGQLAGGLEAAAADLGSLRADLDAVAAALRCVSAVLLLWVGGVLVATKIFGACTTHHTL